MPNSLLFRSPADVTASRPALQRDPMIRPGTKYLFDFTDPRCHPGGVITPGVASIGTTFTSLDKVPVPAVVQAANAITVNADGSLAVTLGRSLLIGADKQFDMSAAEYERLMWMWLKLPAVGYGTSAYMGIAGLTPSNNNRAQGIIDLGPAGLRPRFNIGTLDGASSIGPQAAADITPGQIYQLGTRFDPGARLDLFLNGALSGSTPTMQTDVYTPTGSEALQMAVGSTQAKFTLYRIGMSDLDTSVATETGYGYAAADILTAAQFFAADYAFCTGALAGAPKTPFA